MDWRHVLFAAEQGLVGLLAIVATLPVLVLASSPGRRALAASSSIAAIFVFFGSCLLAGLPNIEASQVAQLFPLSGFAAALLLVAPSIFALRWRWLGLLHLLTVAAVAYLWFVAMLVISHDAT